MELEGYEVVLQHPNLQWIHDISLGVNLNFISIIFIVLIFGLFLRLLTQLRELKLRNKKSVGKDDQAIEILSTSLSTENPSMNLYKKTPDRTDYLGDLYFSADRCFVKEEAENCNSLIMLYPCLINVKFGCTGYTSFHRVCFHAHFDLIELMLLKGANPFLNSDIQESPICLLMNCLIRKRKYKMTKAIYYLNMLQKAGSSLGEDSIWYDILIRMAIRANKKPLIEWMISNGQCKYRTSEKTKIKRQISSFI